MENSKAENLLKIENLTVEYHANNEIVHAVTDVDLSINKGESLGLVGETGAGKTTTAISILRLLPQRTAKITSGTITFQGKDLRELTEEEMRAVRGSGVSMIFQDPMTSLNPVTTVGQQIYEVLHYHNYANKNKEGLNARVDELMELVGIPAERKNEYPHQFSGGMKQRICIAIALACEPALLIADEPTTALDVTIQAQVLAQISELRKKLNTSVLLITHDLGVVAKMCDNVAIMYADEIIEYGTVRDIYKGNEHHPYTIGLFGSIPNLSDKSERLNAIPGLMPDPTRTVPVCSFFPRCLKRQEICATMKPQASWDRTHMIRCHLCTQGKEVE